MMLGNTNGAVHALRKKQEALSASYWFSIVNYNPDDSSWTNRAYLFYAIAFMAIWFFMVLILLAGRIGPLLQLLSLSSGPAYARLLAAVICGWFVVITFKNLFRSPVRFSSVDAQILCQQCVDEGFLAWRWLWQPWFGDAFVFGLLCLLLGFAYAETLYAGQEMGAVFFSYLAFGLRVLAVSLPLHLGLFAGTWIVGLFRLKHSRKKWCFLPGLLLGALLLLGLVPSLFGGFDAFSSLQLSRSVLAWFFQPAFAAEGPALGLVLALGLFFGGACSAMLLFSARGFSLMHAAWETTLSVAIEELSRYGQLDAVTQMKDKKRLGVQAITRLLPSWQGKNAMLWKTSLSLKRLFSTRDMGYLGAHLLLGIALMFLPGILPRLGLMFIYVFMMKDGFIRSLREDLEQWMLIRQSPAGLGPSLLATMLPGLFAFVLFTGLGAVLSLFLYRPMALFGLPKPAWQGLLILPGSIVAASLFFGYDCLRKCQVDRLMVGRVATSSMGGLLLALLSFGSTLALQAFNSIVLNFLVAPIVSLMWARVAYLLFMRQAQLLGDPGGGDPEED